MGFIAGYHVIAYCDSCKKEIGEFCQIETRKEAINMAQDAGCLLSQTYPPNGTRSEAVVICPECVAGGYTILPAEEREGGHWFREFPRYRKRFTNAELKQKGLLEKLIPWSSKL